MRAREAGLWYNSGMSTGLSKCDAPAGGQNGSAADASRFHKPLRNANINYRNGWFFVTWQTAHNKSIFGAIVGDRCELNGLGRKVEEYWRGLPLKYPELELDEFVVMPNHFHAIVRIRFRPTNKKHHLGFLLGRFKGGTGYIYGKMRRAGEVEDIGGHLWQFDYWDKIVTSERQLAAYRRYIRDNPKNWTRDRFGAVTQHSLGNLDLLNGPRIAFVASHGFLASELRPKLVWRRTEVRRSDIEIGDRRRSDIEMVDCCRDDIEMVDCRRSDIEMADCRRSDIEMGDRRRSDDGMGGGRDGMAGDGGAAASVRGASAPPLISTFTSAQEREALRRALAKRRPVIQVVPQGLPVEGALQPGLLAALREGRALLLSPQPPGSSLDKKVAAWCNEYVLRHADEIWTGDIAPNGMLATMMKAMGRT